MGELTTEWERFETVRIRLDHTEGLEDWYRLTEEERWLLTIKRILDIEDKVKKLEKEIDDS